MHPNLYPCFITAIKHGYILILKQDTVVFVCCTGIYFVECYYNYITDFPLREVQFNIFLKVFPWLIEHIVKHNFFMAK